MLMPDPEFLENLDCMPHRLPIGSAAHYDSDGGRRSLRRRHGSRSSVPQKHWRCKAIFPAAPFRMREHGGAIVLIGFMGTGKSSVGRLLAARLQLPRFDTDELVSKHLGMSVAEIFAKLGETKFREAETEALLEVSADCEAVIVTGGGIVLKPENVEQLRRLGVVVNLTCDEHTLFDRLSRRTRPLLQTDNPRATMCELLRVREPLYRAAADFHVDTSELTHEQVANEVIRLSNCTAATRAQTTG
jgi:shikimate kinase